MMAKKIYGSEVSGFKNGGALSIKCTGLSSVVSKMF